MEGAATGPKRMDPYSLKDLFLDVAKPVGRARKEDDDLFLAQWKLEAVKKRYKIHIPSSGIPNYQDEEKLVFYAEQMVKRITIVRNFSLAEPRPLDWLINQLLEQPLSADVQFFNKRHWRHGGDATTRSVHPLLLKDVAEIHQACLSHAVPEHNLDTLCDQWLKNDPSNDYNRKLVIDLAESDEQILNDFKTWLANVRTHVPQLPALTNWWKKIYWPQALALIDICIWAKFNNRKLTSTQIIEAIPALSEKSILSIKKKILKNFTFQEAVKMNREGWRLANPEGRQNTPEQDFVYV